MFRAALVPVAAALLLGACASTPRPMPVTDLPELEGSIVETRHRGADDLLTAGLGLEGLRQWPPPASAEPDAAELRRREIWNAWRGIADLRPQTMSEPLPAVPGREFRARLRLAGDRHPHQVLLQLPDDFDTARPCLVVAPASGSRGVYGAIAVAAPVALPRGCAVVYTDKGAGGDFRLLDDGYIHVPHAHSGDNAEARWGEQVLAAARFGLALLNDTGLPGRFDAGNTRVIAVGLSNGGGAVLQAAELDSAGLLDAVIAAAPNIQPEWTGMRPLYDYATEAALYQPCLLAHPDWADRPFVTPELREQGRQRCVLLRTAGLLDANTGSGQALEARERLRASGWNEDVLTLAGMNIAFDLWRSVAVTYASAYGRFGPDAHPCGFRFAALDGQGALRRPGAGEQALWRSDGGGIPPTAGVTIVDRSAAGEDPHLPGLMCLRGLWTGSGPDVDAVRAGVDSVKVQAWPLPMPVTVLHGADDALIPPVFSSRPWVEAARARGADISYRELPRVQHFDAFLQLPTMAGYQPLLPELWTELEQAVAAPAGNTAANAGRRQR